MPQKYHPTARDAETLDSLLETLRDYDDDQLADCLTNIVDGVQNVGMLNRAIVTAAADRIRQLSKPTLPADGTNRERIECTKP